MQEVMQMKSRAALRSAVLNLALACLIPLAASATVVSYSQDFESLAQTGLTSLSDDGWLVYGNVFTPLGAYIYGYGAFPAPNDGSGFCQIDTLQGGVEQGEKQLAVFSDYNNVDHAAGNLIESNVFQEMTIDSTNVGTVWTFAFDAKMGLLQSPSTAGVYIKTLNPKAGYATTNLITADMTNTPTTWMGYTLSIALGDSNLIGQLLQIGFTNTATLYQPSVIFYDNINFYQSGAAGIPVAMPGVELRPNYPNPFNPITTIVFRLEQSGPVELAVYDVAGRRVAVLADGIMPAGVNEVQWNGKTTGGGVAAAGRYGYVLRTAAGTLSRSMTLVK